MSDHRGNNGNTYRMFVYKVGIAADILRKFYFVIQSAKMIHHVFGQGGEIFRHFSFADIYQAVTQTEHI